MNSPTSVKPTCESSFVYIVVSSKFSKAKNFSLIVNQARRSSVLALLFGCSPAAVLWAVWAVIVNAIQRVKWCRAASHVGDKGVKLFRTLLDTTTSPAFAYFNAATAVVVILTIALAVTPTVHSAPDSILRARLASDERTILSESNRFCEDIGYGPAFFEPIFNSSFCDPCLGGPLVESQLFSIEFNKNRISTIGVLLSACCPSAIIRTVTEVVVDPVNGMMPRRSRPHVGMKINEPVFAAPAITDSDAASAVIFEVSVVWVGTTVDYAVPYKEVACSAFSVLSPDFGCSFSLVATTTLGFSRDNIAESTDLEVSTATLALPESCPAFFADEPAKCEKIKLLTVLVLDNSHDWSLYFVNRFVN